MAKSKKNKIEEPAPTQTVETQNAETPAVRVVLSPTQFTQVCKIGFISTQEKSGKTDLNFTSIDIIALCKGEMVEKDGYDMKYEFKLANMDQYEKREIVKRSPFFGSLHEQV